MVQMLRKEACSGSIEDLAHVPTKFCLSDPLTKATVNAEMLIKSVETGKIPLVDAHPMFRKLLSHKAFESESMYLEAYSLLGGTPYRDYWETQGSLLIRHHVMPRRCLFSPAMSTDLPVPYEQLTPTRTTNATDLFGNRQSYSDTWSNKANQRHPKEESYWTGQTVYIVLTAIPETSEGEKEILSL